LQGYLAGQADIHVPSPTAATHVYKTWTTAAPAAAGLKEHRLRLAREIVVGHAEYRSVAMRSESVRRTFAEAFRARSLLFLGSGLSDPYLLDVFDQVVELYGPSPNTHLAIGKAGKFDRDFLRHHFGIGFTNSPTTLCSPRLSTPSTRPRGGFNRVASAPGHARFRRRRLGMSRW
jgi:hypothetical protein